MPVPKRYTQGVTPISAANLNKTGYNALQVHAQASPDMTVYVEDGVAIFGSTIVKYAGGNSPALTAPTAGNKRIDLITINASGVIEVTQGTQSGSPSAPMYPAGKLVLAEIYLRTSATQIKDEDDSTECYIYKEVRPFVAAGIPTGSISMFGGNTAPSGWLVCDGSAVSRTMYADLFAAISTTYGTGDGSTTFNIPNLKGRVPVGYDSSETEFDVLGETGGEKTHTLTTDEIPAHKHTFPLYNGTSGTNPSRISPNAASGGETDNAGGGLAHNNLQPYIALNFIIKI